MLSLNSEREKIRVQNIMAAAVEANNTITNNTVTNNKYEDIISTKALMFDGEKFDYWKDRIESLFLGFDVDLWDLVIDGYVHPTDDKGNKIDIKSMIELQKNEFRNHHKARTILLNAISYTEYEKITSREASHDIFESLKMTHEGNSQVKETKALALIQKYEAFRMEKEESVESMFSRFQTLVAGLEVLDKGYSTSDHVKKIIKSLPKKWRPMVTALKLSKYLNKLTLEELIISLRSHEIELNEDEPQRKSKSVSLMSNKKSESKALQVLEENSAESSSNEDEMPLLSRRLTQLWKNK